MTEVTRYESMGYGKTSVRFGQRPAVLVVDFQQGLVDPAFPLGGVPEVCEAVNQTREVLRHARFARIPVIHAVLAFSKAHQAPNWKIAGLVEDFARGQPSTKVHPTLLDSVYDVVVIKSAPSLFFQTPAITMLIRQRVDTVIVVGCTTSGCVRATVVDAFSYGFGVFIPRDCVADFELASHDVALRDIERRYAEIVQVSETIRLMESCASD